MANDLVKMDYAAEFLRGWPNSSSAYSAELDRFELASGVDVENGDLVVINSSGKVVLATTEVDNAGIVVRGVETKDVAKNRRPVILWGAYIVRTTKFSGSVAPMAKVNAIAGVFQPATTAAHMGTVLQVNPATPGVQAANIIVRVA